MADYTLGYTGAQIDTKLGQIKTQSEIQTLINNSLESYTSTLYPIGSVYVMSTNTNPSTFLGGSWSLIDKEFKAQNISEISLGTSQRNTTNCSEATVSGTLSGHNILIICNFTSKVTVGDTTLEMFTIPPDSFGVDAFSTQRITFMSDGGDALMQMNLAAAGVLSTLDVGNPYTSTHSVSARSFSQFRVNLFTSYTNMLDSFCNKFYFKRTG